MNVLEELLCLSEAGDHYAHLTGRRRPTLATLRRWISKGARTRDGRYVKLVALRLGHHWFIVRSAIVEFISQRRRGTKSTLHVRLRSPKARQQASQQAARILAGSGA